MFLAASSLRLSGVVGAFLLLIYFPFGPMPPSFDEPPAKLDLPSVDLEESF